MKALSKKDLAELRSEKENKRIDDERLDYLETYLKEKDPTKFKPPKRINGKTK